MNFSSLITYRRALIVCLHLALFPLVFAGAFLLRCDWPIPQKYVELMNATVLPLVGIQLVTFAVFGLYQGWWRYSGMADLSALVKADTVSSGLFVAYLAGSGHLAGFPRSVLLLDWGVCLLAFGGLRLLVRVLCEERIRLLPRQGDEPTPTLIVGAGSAGERLVRELTRRGDQGMKPVAVVDDDVTKSGMRLHGVPVLGPLEELPKIARRYGAELIVIAIPSASRERMTHIVECCARANIPFRVVPSLQELLDGRAQLTQVREVDVTDLLGRPAVQLDMSAIAAEVAAKTVMITGGAGSIGSELARQVAALGPDRLLLVDQAESPLYFIHLELAKAHPHVDVVPLVADVTDVGRMTEIFAAHRPQHVYHAAAYKHVPMMEHNVVEAVRNNVLGTLCVAERAAQHGTRKFVLISTDKAVKPSSVMGATKRIAERIVLGWPGLRRSSTDFRAVRFGNVLGSDGSVVPLFRRQLAKREPLTVTHPDVTRYFMTIPEASRLVMMAAALPEAAERISMLEMGDPIKIADLANNLIRLSGLRPGVDVQLKFTGLRPGEKLCEELMSEAEETILTSVEKIRIVRTDEPGSRALRDGLQGLFDALGARSDQDMLRAIGALVPECVSPLRERVQSRRQPREDVVAVPSPTKTIDELPDGDDLLEPAL